MSTSPKTRVPPVLARDGDATDVERELPRKATGRSVRRAIGGAAVLCVLAASILTLRHRGQDGENTEVVIERWEANETQIAVVGTFVAAHPVSLSSEVEGRVVERRRESGDRVQQNDTLLILANAQLEIDEIEGELQLLDARASIPIAQLRQQSESLSAAISFLDVESARESAVVESTVVARVNGELAAGQLRLSRSREAMTRSLRDVSNSASHLSTNTLRQRVQILERRAAQFRARTQSLRVVAPSAGTLLSLNPEIGSWVHTGDILGRLAMNGELAIQLLVPESKAARVRIGDSVSVKSALAPLRGRVTSVAATVKDGTVLVRAVATTPMPSDARPDQLLEAVIFPTSTSGSRLLRAQIGQLGDYVLQGRACAVASTKFAIVRIDVEDVSGGAVKLRGDSLYPGSRLVPIRNCFNGSTKPSPRSVEP